MQEKQENIGLVWFGNNLRVQDNIVLAKACAAHEKIIGVFYIDPRQYLPNELGFLKTGKFRYRFLQESLAHLKCELHKLNIPLHIAVGKPETGIPQLVLEWKIKCIYAQKEWTFEEAAVTRNLLKRITIPFYQYFDQFLIHPDDVPFTLPEELPEVFTDFRKSCEKLCTIRSTIPVPEKRSAFQPPKGISSVLPSAQSLGLEPAEQDHRTAFPFSGGTPAALERIDHYFWKTKKIGVYKRTRNGLIGPDYSSKLSPWLAFGCISARQIHQEVKAFERTILKNQDTYWLIFELLWRDYFKYISLKHGTKIFYSGGIRDRSYNWGNNPELFHNWINGRTGNDFVDANMLELLHTGWMSNRGRQNVASYWAKELKQDWRLGASWFESMLLDYDVHSNWGNWMYASGVGNDPRDRKFNTRLQAERYDKQGAFRKRWLQQTLF